MYPFYSQELAERLAIRLEANGELAERIGFRGGYTELFVDIVINP